MKSKKLKPNGFAKIISNVSNEIKSLYPDLTDFENLTLTLTLQRNLILAETHETIQNLLSQLCTNGVDLSCINTSLMRLDKTIKLK
jgi:hypothetical protein